MHAESPAWVRPRGVIALEPEPVHTSLSQTMITVVKGRGQMVAQVGRVLQGGAAGCKPGEPEILVWQ